jgi:enamine deaminase RidA (YjgF/YER057c/UK114 family)
MTESRVVTPDGLAPAVGKPADLVMIQIFVTDVAAYKSRLTELGVIWRRHFGHRYPAAGLFGVAELFDPKAEVELMGVAVIGGDS